MKIGDYVRTKKRAFQPSQIAKIKNMEKDSGYKNQYYIELDHYLIPDFNYHIYEEDVKKSSPNIIDLIEVGDIISFKDDSICRIMEIINNSYYLIKDYGGEQYYERKEWIEELKSIVTKEQFECMEYRIGSDNNE